MSKLTMEFPMVLILTLCIGLNVQADPFSGCMQWINLENGLESFVKLATEDQLNVSCSNLTGLMNCVNDVVRNQTGFDVKTLSILLKGTDAGKVFNFFINMTELFEEFCTEDTPLREEYLMDAQCFHDISIDVLKRCQEQAANASAIFSQLQAAENNDQSISKPCVNAAYQLGCLGAIAYEECGNRAFNTYKEVVRRTGYFQSGICSQDIMQTVKTIILDSLESLESRKSVYRIIFDIKRRRK